MWSDVVQGRSCFLNHVATDLDNERMRHRAPTRQRIFIGTLGVLLSCLLSLTLAAAPAAADSVSNAKDDCVYTANDVSHLTAFEQLVGRQFNCALVYNDAAPDWHGWENPWFVNYYNNPDYDWSEWATAPGTNRQLIITQNLMPTSADDDDWLDLGAQGAYNDHARALAENLVAAGLGNAIIRLGHEANGSWYPDSLGSTPSQWSMWDEFWRQTVLAMKSVPGAHFKFDWCIAALWRALPLSQIYPGDDVVDMIGVDAYDTGNLGSTAAARWNKLYTAPDGIKAVLDFAKAHDKPISIPEWGVSPTSANQGFGDDPTFVNGIASVVRNNSVAYQSYFYNYGYATQLADGPLSLSAYESHFGPDGDSVGSGTADPSTGAEPTNSGGDTVAAGGARSSGSKSRPRKRHATAIAIVGGPAAGSVVRKGHVVFRFTLHGSVRSLRCSIDGRSRRCSGARRDAMNLANGRHVWSVTATMSSGTSTWLRRRFAVSVPSVSPSRMR